MRLLDFGHDDGWNGYVGGGVGLANVRYKLDFDDGTTVGSGSDSDRSIAYQAIAGVRQPISDNVDLGLKYRLLRRAEARLSTSIDGEASGQVQVALAARRA